MHSRFSLFRNVWDSPLKGGTAAIDPWTLPPHFVPVTIASFVYFMGVNYFSRQYLLPSKKLTEIEVGEWGTRVASMIHAIFSCIACGVFCYIDPEGYLGREPIFLQDQRVNIIFAFSVGYFICDFLQVLYFNIPPIWHSLIHHLLAGGGLAFASSGGCYAWFGFYLLGCSEVTTVFNNYAWFAKTAGGRSAFSEYAFTVTWFVFRVFNNVVVFYRLYDRATDYFAQHWFLVTLISCNIGFLNLIHFALAGITLLTPNAEVALPMPDWYKAMFTKKTTEKKKSKKVD